VYFAKKGLTAVNTVRIIKWVLALEGIYWLGLLLSGIWGVLPAELAGTVGWGSAAQLGLLVSTGIPCLVGAIGIPLALFQLVRNLDSSKPAKDAIKWGLIAGTLYIRS
jgi:hypothetical protein